MNISEQITWIIKDKTERQLLTTEFLLEPFWTGYTAATCGAQMSYCSFVLTPATPSGCDGWHCSGWLGGGAEVQQINAVEMMQNISFLTFNTYINIAQCEGYWLLAREFLTLPHVKFISSTSCPVVLPWKVNVLTDTTPYWDQLQNFSSLHQKSLDSQTTHPPCSPLRRGPGGTVLPKQTGPRYLL